ncbi:MAG: SIMPL domain-containing protein [Dehalococcoidia bacterium]
MNLKPFIFLTLAALGLFALACSSDTTVLPPTNESFGISVSGAGSVFGAPDVALLSLGVEARADTVAAAREQAAQSMDAMLSSLKDGGVAEEDIQTTRFSVQPEFDFTDNRQVLRGFVVTNSVTAKIRSIDDTGQLIDDAVQAGGNRARVDSLEFTIDDPSSLQDEARRMAVDEARAKAQTLAGAAGVDLGKARTIAESGGPVPIPFDGELAAGGFAEDSSTPIETGELEVRIDVQVVYELK